MLLRERECFRLQEQIEAFTHHLCTAHQSSFSHITMSFLSACKYVTFSPFLKIITTFLPCRKRFQESVCLHESCLRYFYSRLLFFPHPHIVLLWMEPRTLNILNRLFWSHPRPLHPVSSPILSRSFSKLLRSCLIQS